MTAIVALSLGIGANTAIFSVVDNVLLRPLPYPDSGRILRIWTEAPGRGVDRAPLSYQRYLDLAERSRSFEAIGAATADTITLTGTDEPIRLDAARVTSSILDLLRVRPERGRNFLPSEDRRGGAPVAILSDRLWRRTFGSDPRIVGRAVMLDGTSHTVVGVMGPHFNFPDAEVDVWIPRVFEPSFLTSGNVERGSGYLDVFARLRAGVPMSRASTELTTLSRTDRRAGFLDANLAYRVAPLADDMARSVRATLLVLLGASAVVLLIACANVSSLLVARALEHRREVAIHIALGATRVRLIGRYLVEGGLLTAASAVAGVLVGRVGLTLLVAAAASRLPRSAEIHLDARVLGLTLALSTAMTLAFAVVPAFPFSEKNRLSELREAGRARRENRGQSRARDAIVVGEVALATVLLIGAGLLLRTIERLQAVPVGFRSDRLLAATITLPPSRYREADQIREFFSRLQPALAGIPGVRSAAAAEVLPLAGESAETLVAAAGHDAPAVGDRPAIEFDTVTPGYFRTLGVEVLAGREFTGADDQTAPIRIVVSQAFARRFFPGEDPIGRSILIGKSDTPRPIIGMVRDVRQDALDAPPPPLFYLSARQRPIRTMTAVIRTAGDPLTLVPALRRAVASIDRDEPVADLRAMTAIVESSTADRKLVGLLIGAFAMLALVLSAIGISGIIAYSVGRRSAEIGLRIALGAGRGHIWRLTSGRGLLLTLVGLAIGFAGAIPAGRMLRTLLFAVPAFDPATFSAAFFVLLAVAAAAATAPALRAMRADPARILKEE